MSTSNDNSQKSLERVLTILASDKASDHALEINIGLAQGSIKNWKKGRNKVSADALIKIANYFGVSVDYLLVRTDIPELAQSNINVNENQAEYSDLIQKYSALNQEGRDKVDNYIDDLNEKYKVSVTTVKKVDSAS